LFSAAKFRLPMNDADFHDLLELLDTAVALLNERRERPERVRRDLGLVTTELALFRVRLSQPPVERQRN
jgi:hypothetical protein